MIWLIPAAACSITIAAILKVNEIRGGDRFILAGANYIVASLVALLLLRGRIGAPSPATLALGAVTGLDYVLAFIVLMMGIARGPLAIPVTVMRLSVAVPVLASIFIWREQPSSFQWGGIVLGLSAIVFFGFGIAGRQDSGVIRKGYWPLMAAIFVCPGLAGVLLKAFGEVAPDSERFAFTWILFTFSAIFTWAIIMIRRIPFSMKTFRLGLLLGIPNLFSTVFTLKALHKVPASIVFPFINVTVIFGATLLGLLLWKEKLSRLAVAGLLLAAIALVLLPL